MASIELENVQKQYAGHAAAVDGIDLAIDDGEFVVLVGPSGCGKSTTLRMIAGLETVSGGEIRIAGSRVNEKAARDRDIAMVFQNYALYPHMSVRENMAFGLKMRGFSAEETKARVESAAALLDIRPLLDRRPKALSGGQRQRVAMGRAMVREPKVFLFDEPLSNLDAKLRTQMRLEIKRVHQKVGRTTVYVTHDQTEAMTLADRIVVMNKGKIEQIATPHDLYHKPATRFVTGFMGSPSMNFFDGRVMPAAGGLSVDVAFPAPPIPVGAERIERYRGMSGAAVTVGIRPEHFTIVDDPLVPAISATVDLVEPLGLETIVYCSAGGVEICLRTTTSMPIRVGEPLRLAILAEEILLIDPRTDLVL